MLALRHLPVIALEPGEFVRRRAVDAGARRIRKALDEEGKACRVHEFVLVVAVLGEGPAEAGDEMTAGSAIDGVVDFRLNGGFLIRLGGELEHGSESTTRITSVPKKTFSASPQLHVHQPRQSLPGGGGRSRGRRLWGRVRRRRFSDRTRQNKVA